MIHSTDNIRLEVERDPVAGELINLIQNPSGELGGWGWVTPLPNTTIQKDFLQFWNQTVLWYSGNSTTGDAEYFYSEPLPVAAGQYVAAQWSPRGGTTGDYYRVRLEWLNAAKAVLSSTAQSAYYANSDNATKNYGSYLAPASTAYVRLRFDLYDNNTGTNPGSNNAFIVTDVAVAKAATAGALVTTRTNVISNPSFETNTTGWYENNGKSSYLARSTSFAASGTASLAMSCVAASPYYDIVVADFAAPVQGSYTYTLSGQIRPTSNMTTTLSGNLDCDIQWKDASGTVVGYSSTYRTTAVANTWMTMTLTATAPPSATVGVVRFTARNFNNVTGILAYLDKVQLVQESTAGPYIEGSVSTGSLNTSPTPYLNIMGEAYNITTSKKEFDVGTMNVSISDALLDPATNSLIRPGKKIRLLRQGSNGLWEPRFTGKIDDARTDYPIGATGAVQTLVEIKAVNNITTLANTGASNGVLNVADLPYILEGAGVPWNCNGSGNQVSSATVVSFNETAKATDQIEIARATNHGYAWVDNQDVLQVWTPALISQTPKALFSDVRLYDTTVTNLHTNPNIEASSTGYSAANGATLTRQTASAIGGSYGLRVACPNNGITDSGVNINPTFSVTAGQKYTIAVDVRAVTADSYRLSVQGAHAGGISARPLSAGQVSRFTYTFTAGTTGTTQCYILRSTANAAISFDIDNVFVAQGDYSGTYFDGSTPGAVWNGTANASTSTYTPTTGYAPDINVDWDMDSIINTVNIKFLDYDVASSQTKEIAYGPYKSQASIDEWGARSSDFTVHGSTNDNEPWRQAFADYVFTKNATPVIKVNSLTMPVTDVATMDLSTQLDLYSLVRVVFTDKIDANYRITEINETLTPEVWNITYGFGVNGSVVQPYETPSPPFFGTTYDTGWVTPSLYNSWAHFDARTCQYRRIGNQVWIRGLVKSGTVGDGFPVFQLPTDCRPPTRANYDKYWVCASNGGSNLVTVNGGDGWVRISTGTNGWCSFDPITFLTD